MSATNLQSTMKKITGPYVLLQRLGCRNAGSVYSLYNVLIYIPHLIENTIAMAPILGEIFK